jgi:two-component system, chemotaxis family, protein-glutamate methylesterase/glutaminase
MSLGPIRVLIVDDSALVRKMLTAALAGDKDILVVGTAPDAYSARDKILALNPDVITLDIEMPRMDGITFLKKLMNFRPLPTIVISSLGHAACQASVDALRAGAVEILHKPNGPSSIGELGVTLGEKIRVAASAHVKSRPGPPKAGVKPPPSPVSLAPAIDYARDRILAIGASTGGPSAVAEVLNGLPKNVGPVLIVQHMPAIFTSHFASRLNEECQIEVKEAVDGDGVVPGRALVAPGGFHMTLVKSPTGLRVRVADGPLVCFSKPSVDVLFSSVAGLAKDKAVGVILTGMGADGARGLLEMRNKGATTFAQDEDSCVVFGMPKEAIRLNAVQTVLPLNKLVAAILPHLALIRPR